MTSHNPAIGGIRLVLGGNVFGWTADEAASFAILDAFVAAGGRMIDTADAYSVWVPGHDGGESERVIGRWMRARGNRDQVLLATKTGMLGGPGALSPERTAAACDASLARLQTDYIDLYYAHRDDDLTPQSEVAAGFAALEKAGKIRASGASNFTADRLETARRAGSIYRVVQPEYHLLRRDVLEGALQSFCAEADMAVCNFYSLAAGYLTGKYRNIKSGTTERSRSVARYDTPKGAALLSVMDQIAAETGATLAQIAIAWVLAQPGITAPITSATSVAQLEELIAATELELSADQLARLSV
jgi:aryl-alcohol dehydrogenase-like predicted oxidoreductase